MRTAASLFINVLAMLLLVLLAPLMAGIALSIVVDTRRSPIFCQRRTGQYGRVFTIYKFRTMTDLRDTAGRLWPDEERLTPLGRFLRQTSLDELPQLWNIARGDMAIVGPRPLLPQYLPRYTPYQARRCEVKPGITGLAQIKGRNALTWERKFELDVWYVDHATLWLDIKIVWMTIGQVIRRNGISQQGQATMREFMGSGK